MINFIKRLIGMKVDRVYCAKCVNIKSLVVLDPLCLKNPKVKHNYMLPTNQYELCKNKNRRNNCKDFERR